MPFAWMFVGLQDSSTMGITAQNSAISESLQGVEGSVLCTVTTVRA